MQRLYGDSHPWTYTSTTLNIMPMLCFQVGWRPHRLWPRNKRHNDWSLQAKDVKDIQLISEVTTLSPFKHYCYPALLLYGLYFTISLPWISRLCIRLLGEFCMKVSVRHFEWHCFCQTADWRRHREKCCANEIVWPTSFSAIHFSKDTERAFIQVNHDWSLKWKKAFFSEGRGTSIIYYTGVARHLGDNAVLQAYKT